MERTILNYFFIAGCILFLGIIIFFLRKNTLSLKYALIWLFSDLGMLILSIFPSVLAYIANFLGFVLLSNAVFTILLAFVIIISLQITSVVSRQSEEIKKLAQANALLEKRVRELENKDHANADRSIN